MTKRKYHKKKKTKPPDIHPDLEGFDIKIDSFGEVQSSYDIDEINTFLSKNLVDKKLKKRADKKKENPDGKE